MSIEKLHPYAGSHAVQSVAFSIEWAGNLTEADIVKVKERHRQNLAATFPDTSEPQLLQFSIEAGGTPQVTAPGKATAVTFSKPNQVRSLGVVRTIQVMQDRLVVVIHDYLRWSTSWAQVQAIVTEFAPLLFGDRRLVAVGLQYNDVFSWRDAPTSLDLRKVFSEATAYLPSHVFGVGGLWHAHHGYFEDSNGKPNHSMLHNVNVGVQDIDDQRSISITTSHRANFGEPIWHADNSVTALTSLFPVMHAKNKEILRDLLSEEVKRKIDLQGEPT